MPDRANSSRKIRILRDDVSRKIAAGEVIDRPFSIVRELLDNSIDAGAAAIDVYLEGGGIGRIRVVDDGAGMDGEDLKLAWQPHATSKIETEDDLLHVKSLGFRGEALSSIAVAARLEMVSAQADGATAAASAPASAEARTAHQIVIRGGKLLSFGPCQGRKGTTVDISELFFDYPARKKFLRSASAESSLCRSIFVDRAVAHPSVSFRLFAEGLLKVFLPPAGELERIALACGQGLDPRHLRLGEAAGDGFTVRVAAADPSFRRRDRKLIQVYVNNRRVPEYSLIQAAEYGFSGYVPGGWYPVAFVFVQIDPSLVDFNIHPAKKEVRFRNLPEVHAATVRAVQESLGAAVVRPSYGRPGAVTAPGRETPPERLFGGAEAGPRRAGRVSAGGQFSAAPRGAPSPSEAGREAGQVRFLGQVFGVFLVFEMPDRVVLLDQHAAHERLIFDGLAAQSPVRQEMLFPLSFDVSEDEEKRLVDEGEALEAIGVIVRHVGSRSFEVVALSPTLSRVPEAELLEMLKGSISAGAHWRRELMARVACRLAMKEGDPVDPVTAIELLGGAMKLDSPRCPHGRPIWHEIPRTQLFRLVDRT